MLPSNPLTSFKAKLPVGIKFLKNLAISEEIHTIAVVNPGVKRNNRKRILASNNNAIYELLSANLNRKIEFHI